MKKKTGIKYIFQNKVLLTSVFVILFSNLNRAQYLGGTSTGYASIESTAYIPLQEKLLLDVKIFIEGAYISSGTMSTQINDSLPKSSPYLADTISISSIPNSSIVDWILVELRDKADSSLIVESRAGFLMNNGNIYDVDGMSPLSFNVWEDEYYLVIRQRNHLSVMSATTVNLSITN